jgi:hypothetical protein
MFSNIVGTPNEKLEVGQRVKVAFEQRDEDLVVPVFEVSTGPEQEGTQRRAAVEADR